MNYNDIMSRLFDEAVAKTTFYKEINECAKNGDKLTLVNKIIEKYNCSFDDARIVCDHLTDKIPLPTDLSHLSPQQQVHHQAVAREALNKPKCPTCNSTNLSKISTISKAGSVAMFGLLSQKVKKQFHCNNCGYEW